MLRSEGRGVPLGALEGLEVPLGGLGVLLGGSGGLVAAKFVECPKSYYTEQFEKYGYIPGYIRDKYDTTYNTPTPYDPSLVRNVHLEMDSKVMYVLLEVDSRVMHLSQSCILASEF